MKIRTDYVSNSSSSSFVIWGCQLNTDELTKLYDKLQDSDKSSNGDDMLDDIYWILDKKFDTVICDHEYNDMYVGSSPDCMHDDETLREFKQKISDKLKSIGIDKCVNDIKYFTGVSEDGYISFN